MTIERYYEILNEFEDGTIFFFKTPEVLELENLSEEKLRDDLKNTMKLLKEEYNKD